MFSAFMCVIKGTEANDTKKTAEIIKDENYEKRFLCVVSNLSAAEDIGKRKKRKYFFCFVSTLNIAFVIVLKGRKKMSF